MIRDAKTKQVMKRSIEILTKDLRHHFDQDWYDVRMRMREPEGADVDAFSIICVDPNCKMRFDINTGSYSVSHGESYLLWNGCYGVGEFHFDTVSKGKSWYKYEEDVLIEDNIRLGPCVVCRKLQSML